jgi:hypothetical protein
MGLRCSHSQLPVLVLPAGHVPTLAAKTGAMRPREPRTAAASQAHFAQTATCVWGRPRLGAIFRGASVEPARRQAEPTGVMGQRVMQLTCDAERVGAVLPSRAATESAPAASNTAAGERTTACGVDVEAPAGDQNGPADSRSSRANRSGPCAMRSAPCATSSGAGHSLAGPRLAPPTTAPAQAWYRSYGPRVAPVCVHLATREQPSAREDLAGCEQPSSSGHPGLPCKQDPVPWSHLDARERPRVYCLYRALASWRCAVFGADLPPPHGEPAEGIEGADKAVGWAPAAVVAREGAWVEAARRAAAVMAAADAAADAAAEEEKKEEEGRRLGPAAAAMRRDRRAADARKFTATTADAAAAAGLGAGAVCCGIGAGETERVERNWKCGGDQMGGGVHRVGGRVSACDEPGGEGGYSEAETYAEQWGPLGGMGGAEPACGEPGRADKEAEAYAERCGQCVLLLRWMRARGSARERIRSVRRWQLLYYSCAPPAGLGGALAAGAPSSPQGHTCVASPPPGASCVFLPPLAAPLPPADPRAAPTPVELSSRPDPHTAWSLPSPPPHPAPPAFPPPRYIQAAIPAAPPLPFPSAPWQAACLTRASVSWREWRMYNTLARTALEQGVRAANHRLQSHCWAQWRLFIRAAALSGGLRIAPHAFAAWRVLTRRAVGRRRAAGVEELQQAMARRVALRGGMRRLGQRAGALRMRAVAGRWARVRALRRLVFGGYRRGAPLRSWWRGWAARRRAAKAVAARRRVEACCWALVVWARWARERADGAAVMHEAGGVWRRARAGEALWAIHTLCRAVRRCEAAQATARRLTCAHALQRWRRWRRALPAAARYGRPTRAYFRPPTNVYFQQPAGADFGQPAGAYFGAPARRCSGPPARAYFWLPTRSHSGPATPSIGAGSGRGSARLYVWRWRVATERSARPSLLSCRAHSFAAAHGMAARPLRCVMERLWLAAAAGAMARRATAAISRRRVATALCALSAAGAVKHAAAARTSRALHAARRMSLAGALNAISAAATMRRQAVALTLRALTAAHQLSLAFAIGRWRCTARLARALGSATSNAGSWRRFRLMLLGTARWREFVDRRKQLSRVRRAADATRAMALLRRWGIFSGKTRRAETRECPAAAFCAIAKIRAAFAAWAVWRGEHLLMRAMGRHASRFRTHGPAVEASVAALFSKGRRRRRMRLFLAVADCHSLLSRRRRALRLWAHHSAASRRTLACAEAAVCRRRTAARLNIAVRVWCEGAYRRRMKAHLFGLSRRSALQCYLAHWGVAAAAESALGAAAARLAGAVRRRCLDASWGDWATGHARIRAWRAFTAVLARVSALHTAASALHALDSCAVAAAQQRAFAAAQTHAARAATAAHLALWRLFHNRRSAVLSSLHRLCPPPHQRPLRRLVLKWASHAAVLGQASVLAHTAMERSLRRLILKWSSQAAARRQATALAHSIMRRSHSRLRRRVLRAWLAAAAESTRMFSFAVVAGRRACARRAALRCIARRTYRHKVCKLLSPTVADIQQHSFISKMREADRLSLSLYRS